MSFKKILLSLVLVTGIVSFTLWAQKPPPVWSEKPKDSPVLVQLPDLRSIIAAMDKAVVNIATTTAPDIRQEKQPWGGEQPPDPFRNPEDFFERFFGQPFQNRPQQPRRALGSGFIISKDGYILTNAHVVEGADRIEVVTLSEDEKQREGETFVAKIVGKDLRTDIALLKIESKSDLTFAYLGDSSLVQKGDWVLAFGNPFALDHSVSFGMISAKGREISPNENRRFDDFLQTDAAINFGNSGGPLVNTRGEVIGINTAITAQGSGIGFAVPINIAKKILLQLKEKGGVSRGYLGVMIQDITDEMKTAMNLKDKTGALINDLVPDGPAAKSDLKRGDIILEVNGQPIEDARSLQRIVADINPQIPIILKVTRDNKILTVKMKLGALDQEAPKEKKGAEKPDRMGLKIQWDSQQRTLQIIYVEPQSAADKAHIQVGDIIRKIKSEQNAVEVTGEKDYEKIISKVKSEQIVLFDLERGEYRIFIAVKVP